MKHLAWILLALNATTEAQTPVQFQFAFNGGLNLRDRPTVLGVYTGGPSIYAVDNSFNGDFNVDGSWAKRKGTSTDKIGMTGVDSAITFMGWLPTDGYGGRGPVLLHSWTKWFRRATTVTGEGTYTAVTAPAGLTTLDTTYIGSTLYGSELFIAPRLGKVARFDGLDLFKVALEETYKAVTGEAVLIGGGSLSGTYYYTHSFLSKFSQVDGTSQEGPMAAPVKTATSGSYRTISYRAPTKPTSLQSGIDTTQLVGINVWRGTDGATFNYLGTIRAGNDSLIDTGATAVDLTKQPDPEQIYTSVPGDVAEYNDFLFQLGRQAQGRNYTKWLGILELHSMVTITGGFQYCWSVWGDANGDMHVDTTDAILIQDEVLSPGQAGFRVENADVTNSGTITATDASWVLQYVAGTRTPNFNPIMVPFSMAGISPGDTLTDGTNERIIAAVLSDTTFTIVGDSLAQFSTQTYIVRARTYDAQGIYYSPVGNPPILLNWSNPFAPIVRHDEMLRLLGTPYGLSIWSRNALWLLTGTSEADFNMQRVRSSGGVVGAGALFPWLDGAIVLQQDGAYVLQGAGLSRFSTILGNAITDSTASNRLSDALVFALANDVYIATPYSGDASLVWKFDGLRNTWTKYMGWYPASFASWPTGGDARQYAFWGDRRGGNIYKVDPARTADVSISGADSAITAQLITPQFGATGKIVTWQYASLTFDTNDTVTVTATVGAVSNAGVSTTRTKTLLSLSPANAADSTIFGVPRTWRTAINEVGQTLQLTIKTTGTGRCVVYPGLIHAVLAEEN